MIEDIKNLYIGKKCIQVYKEIFKLITILTWGTKYSHFYEQIMNKSL